MTFHRGVTACFVNVLTDATASCFLSGERGIKRDRARENRPKTPNTLCVDIYIEEVAVIRLLQADVW